MSNPSNPQKANTNPSASDVNRRKFLGEGARIAGGLSIASIAAFVAGRQTFARLFEDKSNVDGLISTSKKDTRSMVWQIDPNLCVACNQCTENCVLDVTAVRCFHNTEMCGYCNRCSGYFQLDAAELESGAENQLCPTGAIIRRFIEDPYYEYEIDKDLCIGCGKCVRGCGDFGNGSLFLQIDHDICLHCNECAVARGCPSQALRRVPADEAYIIKQQ